MCIQSNLRLFSLCFSWPLDLHNWQANILSSVPNTWSRGIPSVRRGAAPSAFLQCSLIYGILHYLLWSPDAYCRTTVKVVSFEVSNAVMCSRVAHNSCPGRSLASVYTRLRYWLMYLPKDTSIVTRSWERVLTHVRLSLRAWFTANQIMCQTESLWFHWLAGSVWSQS